MWLMRWKSHCHCGLQIWREILSVRDCHATRPLLPFPRARVQTFSIISTYDITGSVRRTYILCPGQLLLWKRNQSRPANRWRTCSTQPEMQTITRRCAEGMRKKSDEILISQVRVCASYPLLQYALHALGDAPLCRQTPEQLMDSIELIHQVLRY